MHYTTKLRAALDLSNRNTENLLLGETAQTLVGIAAALADGMRLSPLTFDGFLRGHIAEGALIAEMRRGILVSEDGGSAPYGRNKYGAPYVGPDEDMDEIVDDGTPGIPSRDGTKTREL